MDKRRRRSARSSKVYWWAARGALSSSGVDAVLGAVLDDASTNTHKCSGIRVLLVDDKAEVAKVRCNPASLGIWAGMVVSEGIWGQLKLMTGDDSTRILPSRSEGLEAKSWAKDLREGRGEDSEVMPLLSCILRPLIRIGWHPAVPGFPFWSLTGFPVSSLAFAPWAQSISTAFSARITFL